MCFTGATLQNPADRGGAGSDVDEPCELCGYVLREDQTMSAHRQHHKAGKDFHVCDECGAMYEFRSDLLWHQQSCGSPYVGAVSRAQRKRVVIAVICCRHGEDEEDEDGVGGAGDGVGSLGDDDNAAAVDDDDDEYRSGDESGFEDAEDYDDAPLRCVCAIG